MFFVNLELVVLEQLVGTELEVVRQDCELLRESEVRGCVATFILLSLMLGCLFCFCCIQAESAIGNKGWAY